MTTETNDNTDTPTEDVSGLKSKNRELHGIIKNLEKQVAKLTDEVEEAADNARAESGTELDKANRRILKLEKDLESANTRAATSEKGLRDYKASNALTAAIASANVDSDHINMLTKAFRADIEFDETGEATIEGKSIEAYTKAFFSGSGKRYVRAADHDGGGATGSQGAQTAAFTKLPETGDEWTRFNSLPTVERNAYCDRFGAPQLKV